MLTKKIKIATRASKLAIAQANLLKNTIINKCNYSSEDIEIFPIITKGDKILDINLSEIGGKGLFTEEIENGLMLEEFDLAIHSMKDMPTKLPKGLIIAATLEREDYRDVLVGKNSLSEIEENSNFGTSSTRRAAIINELRPDLNIVPFRGNLQTRLETLKNKVAEATILASAGINRLDIKLDNFSYLSEDVFIPAVGQGLLAIEINVKNTLAKEICEQINNKNFFEISLMERTFLSIIDGSCKTPVGGLCKKTNNNSIVANFMVLSKESKVVRVNQEFNYQKSFEEIIKISKYLKSVC